MDLVLARMLTAALLMVSYQKCVLVSIARSA